MARPAQSIRTLIIIILFSFILSHFLPGSEASSLSDAVSGLNIEHINSVDEMKSVLSRLQSCVAETQEKDQFTFDLQKLILAKSGECISKLAACEQQADLSQKAKRDEIRALFFRNRDVLKGILSFNQKKIDYLQENKLDQMKDTSAFFASPEWQEPQYVISLCSYWLSWNGYYSSHLYPAQDPLRKEVLEDAVSGFSRALIDFKEESIVVRSLLGRALCYKELQKYDKAFQDITLVIGKVKRDDPLYVRSRYEKMMISYLTGDYEAALNQLHEFQKNVREENIPEVLREGLSKLQVKIILGRLEKQAAKQGSAPEKYYHEAWQELNSFFKHDESLAEELYQFAQDHVAVFSNFSDAELGVIGNLALADWYFSQKQYDSAIVRYKRLYAFSDPFIRKRMDDVYFRLGYCLCQKGQWQDALSSFESLFEKSPQSPLAGKTACLSYVAAANGYKENPVESMYARYIEAIKIFLKYCTDSRDKSEAHFQLGRYYQNTKREKESLREFSVVEKDSPNYAQAKYYAAKSNIDTLESLYEKGLRQSAEARKLYQDAREQLAGWQALSPKGDAGTDRRELEAHMTILRARLHIYGPEGAWKEALHILAGFEKQVAPIKNSEQLCLVAKSLRMECYLQLHLFREAEEEIAGFLREGDMDSNRWTFLYEAANRFYHKAKTSRSKNSDMAQFPAHSALLLYDKLSFIALHNTSYKQFSDPIQFRMAELYQDGNQTAKAKMIYQEKLKSDPLSAAAIYNLGLIYEKEGLWEEALDMWGKYAQGLKTDSNEWFEARYRTAKVLNQLGKADEACEIITMTQVLHPTLRDEAMKEKFTKLQKEVCRKK